MSPEDPEIRRAVPEDIDVLPEIERIASLLFKTYPGDLGIPEELYDQPNSIETFEAARKAGRLWVASASGKGPVGFALVLEIGGCAHLEELDVLPAHQGQGVGSALLDAVCAWAKASGYPAVTLRTFRDVPWNAPFYQRRGFQIVESAALSPGHLALEASERQRGLRTDTRVTMVLKTVTSKRADVSGSDITGDHAN
jgi:GNAT superfamily N-acetyltransferase